jgi:hypothetical protein
MLKIAVLSVGKRTMKSAPSVRWVKICHMKTDDVIHVHMNKWLVVDVHHVSILPIFSPLLLACCFIHFNHCLHNMDYDQLTDEIHFCDGKLVCQTHIHFLQLFSALIPFNV